MQRHRQRHRALPGQPVDLRHHARGGKGHAAARQPVGMVIEHDAQRGHHVAEIRQGFTHAHHHHVADDAFRVFLRFGRHRPALDHAEFAVGHPQLADDLGHAQVAVEALGPGRTECALERTANLAGHAQRAAIDLGDEHGLDRVATARGQQPLARAVSSRGVGDDRQRRNFGSLDQLRTERLRKICHLAEIVLAGLVDPAHQLLCAERALAHRCAVRNQSLQIEIEQVDLHQRG